MLGIIGFGALSVAGATVGAVAPLVPPKIDEGVVFVECFGPVDEYPANTMVHNRNKRAIYKIDNENRRIYLSDDDGKFIDQNVYDFYSDQNVLRGSYESDGIYGSISFDRYNGLVDHKVLHTKSAQGEFEESYFASCEARRELQRSGPRF